MACRGADNLGFVAEAIDEQGSDRPVNQARGQCFFFRRSAFALKKAAGHLASSIGLFHIVYGKRKKIDACASFSRGDGSAEHGCVFITDHDGAIGLASNVASFQDQLTPTPHQFLTMNFKHLVLSFSLAMPAY